MDMRKEMRDKSNQLIRWTGGKRRGIGVINLSVGHEERDEG